MRPAVGAGASWTTADMNRHAARWGPTLGRLSRRLPARRSVMDYRGFSLVELLVVMIVMGILASMAFSIVPPKRAVYLAVMKSDLRTLTSAQEGYFADQGPYGSSLADVNFDPSDNVQVTIEATLTGWTGRTTYELRDDFRCAFFLGTGVTPLAPATEEGVIACEPESGGGGGGCFGG